MQSYPVKKLALSITSWMCVPEQGMRDFEVLCRASAFLIRAKEWRKEKGVVSGFAFSAYIVLTVSHVVAPWKWPKLYPDEWLQFVNETHTHYTVELRHEDGVFMNQSDMQPKVFHHPSRDLAVLHLEEENDVIDMLVRLNVEVNMEIAGEQSRQYPLKDSQVL